ncbi:hypothetical protein BH20CHL6_BH20CHL6_19920 [soil metagenome]
MKFRSRSLAALAALLLLLTTAIPLSLAGANGPATLVVDDDGEATATDCKAVGMAFDSIQLAVDAASPGDIIKVCPGTYNESVTVGKFVRLRGAQAGVFAERCGDRGPESTVTNGDDGAFRLEADRIVLNGFRIANNTGPGITTSADFSGYHIRSNKIENNAGGLDLASAGPIRSYINRNCFDDNNVGLGNGGIAGDGIASERFTRNVNINNNGFRSHANNALDLTESGEASPTSRNVSIVRNTSIDNARLIRIDDARGILLLANRASGSGQSDRAQVLIGDDDGATAINLIGNRIAVADADDAILIGSDGDDVLVYSNILSDASDDGIDVLAETPGAVVVRNNRVTNTGDNGIELGDSAAQNHIVLNVASGSADLDCRDESTGEDTAGTANNWRANTGATSDPPGLCRPPAATATASGARASGGDASVDHPGEDDWQP